MADPVSLLELIVEPDALDEVREALGGRHSKVFVDDDDARVVESRQVKAEVESAGPNDSSHSLEARLYVATFPAGDDGLRLAEAAAELSLGETGSEPSLPNQVTTQHGSSVVQICYTVPLRSRSRGCTSPRTSARFSV